MFPWHQIDTLLLDMDGTLLDLHFDNHFWLNVVPEQLSQQHGFTRVQAQQKVEQAYNAVAGTLNWYSLDYWQQQLDLDIFALHHTIIERIQLRHDSMPFLEALQEAGKRRILVTNAHPKSLSLKLFHTGMAEQFDDILSSHETGFPKEHPKFWEALFERYQLDPQRCLFVDDSEPILRAAQQAGVAHQLGICNPDSQKPHQEFTDFPEIGDYHLLLGGLGQEKIDEGK